VATLCTAAIRLESKVLLLLFGSTVTATERALSGNKKGLLARTKGEQKACERKNRAW